jgi:hypothetical protein
MGTETYQTGIKAHWQGMMIVISKRVREVRDLKAPFF